MKDIKTPLDLVPKAHQKQFIAELEKIDAQLLFWFETAKEHYINWLQDIIRSDEVNPHDIETIQFIVQKINYLKTEILKIKKQTY